MKRLALGISSGILFTLLSIGVALFTAPYFLQFISKEEFGAYYLANNLIVWTGLLNGGLRGSFKLQLASSLARGEETGRLTTTILVAQCVVAFAVAFTGFVLSFFLASFFELPEVFVSDAQYVFRILSFSFACSLISNSFAAILSVHNRDVNSYTARSVLLVLQALLSVVLLSFGWGIKGLALATLLSETAFLGYMFFLVSSKYRLASFHLSGFDRKLLSRTLSVGKWFLAGFFAQLLIRHTDLLLVGKLAGLKTVTAFLFTSKLYLLAAALLQMMVKILSPQMIRLVQSDASKHFSEKAKLLFLKFVLGYTLIAGAGIYIFNKAFISWWIGELFYLGDEINLMLMFAFIFSSCNLAIRALFLAQMQLKPQKISALTEGLLHLSLSALLGIFYGLQGMVAGIALSSMLAAFISFIPFFTTKKIAGTGRDTTLVISFICVVLLVLLALPASPAPEKSFRAFIVIAVTFILLFLKDLRFILSRLSDTTLKK